MVRDFNIETRDYVAVAKIAKSINKLNLDLSNLKILTEVGSNYYKYTPIIAAMAGAEKVFAWTRDTSYGAADTIIEDCFKILRYCNLEDRVEFFNGRLNETHLTSADIITNSGFIRPLDENKLKHIRKNAVIPLMYEKWELRNSDIDVTYAQSKGIKIAGTWENHPSIRVFEYVGSLAVKMALTAGFEIFKNKIVVWSDDSFGEVTQQAFLSMGAKEVILTTSFDHLVNVIRETDFIFICDYDEDRKYGDPEFFDIFKLLKLNAYFGIVHLYGNIEYDSISSSVTVVYPHTNGKASQMSFTLGHLGLNPIIDLQVAGFKVGEEMIKGVFSSLSQSF